MLKNTITTMRKKSGFTLIELLVVVSIIGLLSSIVLASLNQAKKKATASSIVQEFIQVRNAIELYRAQWGVVPCQYGQSQGCTINGSKTGTSANFNNNLFNSNPTVNARIGLVGTDKSISSIYYPPAGTGYSFEYNTMDSAQLTMANNGQFYSCGDVPFGTYTLTARYDSNGTNLTALEILKMTNLPQMYTHNYGGSGSKLDIQNYPDANTYPVNHKYCITSQ